MNQVGQGALQGLHAVLGTGLNQGVELGGLAFANQVGAGRCVDHDLEGHHPAHGSGHRPGCPAQGLGEHCQETGAQLNANLGLLPGGEHIHHPVHGLRGGTGVESAEDQVACFGGCDGELDGFQVAKLTDEDHIGILPQGRPQGVGKAACVFVHLALMNQRPIILIGEFDRIFDGENMFSAGVVDVVEQGGQGRGFS